MRIAFKILFASISLTSLLACSANVSSSPDDIDSGVVATDDGPDVVDSGSPEKDAAQPGTPCVVAADCPTFVCPKCPAAELQECTGANVCATEEQVCASITCDATDGG